MSTNDKIIIGINPGWRYLGVAVLVGTSLQDWRIRVVAGTTLQEKLHHIDRTTVDLIRRYRPTAVALKQSRGSRSGDNLDTCIRKIEHRCAKDQVPIYRYPILTLKRIFLPGRKESNKKMLAEILAVTYPALHRQLIREGEIKNPYYIRMFEAVAAAVACAKELSLSQGTDRTPSG